MPCRVDGGCTSGGSASATAPFCLRLVDGVPSQLDGALDMAFFEMRKAF
jgi:hypothetical protein